MCQVVCLVVVPVPCRGQVDGNVLAAEFLLVFPGFGDVAVLGKSAVFCVLQVVGVYVGVHIVPVAQVIAVQDGTELAEVLAGIVASGVVVVKLEAYTRYLVDVGGKVASHTVFAVLASTAGMVGKVGDGTLGVGEEEIAHTLVEEIQRSEEDEVAVLLPVDEDPVQACRTCIAGMRKVALHAVLHLPVLEVVHGGVGVFGGYDIAQAVVYFPLEHAHGQRHLLSSCGVSSPRRGLPAAGFLVFAILVVVQVVVALARYRKAGPRR